jgi:hypothetical protein
MNVRFFAVPGFEFAFAVGVESLIFVSIAVADIGDGRNIQWRLGFRAE